MALYVGGVAVTGTQVLDATKLSGNLPALNGASVTALNGTQLTSGTIPNGRYGTPTFNGSNLTNISGGKVKQIVSASGGAELMTSSTLNSTGLFATISPSASTSSLLVFATTPRIYNNGVEELNASIYKGTSGQGSGSAVQGLRSDGGGFSGNTDSPATMTVHIPASGVTTADHTFTVMHANDNNSTLVGWYQGASNHNAEITVMEILA